VQRFEFTLSPRGSLASQTILQRRLAAFKGSSQLSAIEVGAEAMAVAEAIALRIQQDDGFALLVDYGQDAPYDMSLNAIRKHEAVHPLQVSSPIML
jgi:SAM-dependent MidA family methyltransferase